MSDIKKSEQRWQSDVIVDLMKLYDIPYVALNPGASYRGLHDSMVNYGENDPEMLLCNHEKIAVQIAHGYAKASGKPMIAIVHDVVGLLHAPMGVYYAYIDRCPVFVIGATGPMDEKYRRPFIDWIHTAFAQGDAVRNFTKWDYQPGSIHGVPDSFARAYSIMMSEPQGPIYMCYDSALQETPLTDDISIPPASAVKVPSRIAPEQAVVAQAAEMLVKADNPLLLTEYAARMPEGFEPTVELAETVGASVFDVCKRLGFPNRHPLSMSFNPDAFAGVDLGDGAGRGGLDPRLPPAQHPDPRDHGGDRAGLQVGGRGFRRHRDQQVGHRLQQAQQLGPAGDGGHFHHHPRVDQGVRLADRRGPGAAGARRRPQEGAGGQARAAVGQVAEAGGRGDGPAAHDRVPAGLRGVAGDQGRGLGADRGTLKDWVQKIWDFDKPYRHPGRELGTGTQIGMSIGVALAHKGQGKLVVDLQPDGDLMFDLGALWMPIKYDIPMLVVMYNNRAYYNDWAHQIHMAHQRGTDPNRAYIGMDLEAPPPDFAHIARGMGWYAEGPIEDPAEVVPAVRRAIEQVKAGKPALVDPIVWRRDINT